MSPDLIGFRSGKAGNLDYSVMSDFLARLLAELDVGPVRLVVHELSAILAPRSPSGSSGS